MQAIIDNITLNAPMPTINIVKQYVDEWLNSDTYKTMLNADDYYRVKNDITQRKRLVLGANGNLVEARNLANNKIAHGFVRDLVDQKAQYLLGNDWAAKTDNVQYQDMLDGFFNDEFRKTLRRAGKDSINKGVGWLHAYIDELGDLKVKRMQPEEIIPLWLDIDHTKLQGVIRVFNQVYYEGEKRKDKRIVQYWHDNGVSVYEGDSGTSKLVLLEETTHLSDANWLKIPFIAIKYNDEEQPLLPVIKGMVDEYDRTVSDVSNLLEDMPNGINKVKGASGTEVDSFVKNLSVYRTVIVPEGGDYEKLSTPVDISSNVLHQNQLRKNIYTFGRGVDTNAEFGANASAEARQYQFAQLDLDCNQLEEGIQSALQELLWFILSYNNKLNVINDSVKFNFSRNMMINTTQVLENCVKMQGIAGVSMETVVNTVPFVENALDEIEKWKSEQLGAEDDVDYAQGGGASETE